MFISKKCKIFILIFFLAKGTLFVLIKETLLKIESCVFRPNNASYDKMLKSKIVHLKEIINFDFDHFLIKRTVLFFILKKVIKNQKFNFPEKLFASWKNFKKQNCLFQKDIRILFGLFFDKMYSFCYNRDKYY